MRKYLFFIVCSVVLIACNKPEARRPVQQHSGSFIQESVERNKELYEQEEKIIQSVIDRDSLNEYKTSSSGFWYTYQIQDTIGNPTPAFGDIVTFTYDIQKLDGTQVLTEQETGLQRYAVDKTNQELISGIRDGIKLMKAGERITFIFPSYKAYGYYGIENKLGTNVPVKSTITLQTIKKQTEN